MERIEPNFTTWSEQNEKRVVRAAPVSKWAAPIAISLFCLFFLGFKHWSKGIHAVHVAFAGAIFLLYFLHPLGRKFLIIALPVVLYGLIYDFFRYIPFSWLHPVHVQDLYQFDLQWFGVWVDGAKLHLHEYIFGQWAHPLLDFLSGVFYMLHIPVFVVFLGIFLLKHSAELTERFAFAFFLMNVFAFFTYFLFPAAAPWYVAKFGFIQPSGPIPGDAAGLVRFDTLLGIDLFSKNYQISPVTFGALPSMHAGVATLIWLYSFKLSRRLGAVFWLYPLAMCFSALYLQHHYLTDLLLGVAFAFLSWGLTEQVLARPLHRANHYLKHFFGVKGAPA